MADAHQRWMDRYDENSQPTSEGTRLSFTVYVYPDGHGSLYFLKPQSKTIDKPGRWVANTEQAVEAFRAIWEEAVTRPK